MDVSTGSGNLKDCGSNWQMESSGIINSEKIGYIVNAQLKCKRLHITI